MSDHFGTLCMKGLIIFMASNILNISNRKKYARFKRIFPYISLFETFVSNGLFVTITKPLCDEIEETFSERLKWMYKLSEIDKNILNPFSANLTKWSNTLKQFVGSSHFVKLTLKRLKTCHFLKILWVITEASCRQNFECHYVKIFCFVNRNTVCIRGGVSPKPDLIFFGS